MRTLRATATASALVEYRESLGDDEVEALDTPMATAWVHEFDERARVGPRQRFDRATSTASG